MSKLRRSAATRTPLDIVRVGIDNGPRAYEAAGDVAAVSRGDSVIMLCYFRRLYGDHPRRFHGYLLELAASGPVLRRGPLFLRRRPVPIPEQFLSARVRPFENQAEAFKFASTGIFAPGSPREWSGFSIISCQTPDGVIEFAVGRRDVGLLLHYIGTLRRRGHDGPPRGTG